MKDMEGFSAWMEEGLDEAINKLGCEKVAICFLLESGDVMTGYWQMGYADKKDVAEAIREDALDDLVRANIGRWLEEYEAEREEENE